MGVDDDGTRIVVTCELIGVCMLFDAMYWYFILELHCIASLGIELLLSVR